MYCKQDQDQNNKTKTKTAAYKTKTKVTRPKLIYPTGNKQLHLVDLILK